MITALVLAAGAGERLGGPKALAEIEGRSFLARVLAPCSESLVDAVVVVGGCRADEVRAACERDAARHAETPVTFVENERWTDGRTGSLQRGWLEVDPAHHVLVFPVDHPLVEVTTLDLLLGVFGYAASLPEVIAPVLQEGGRRRRGHPIVLGAALRDAVLAMGAGEPLHDLVHSRTVLEVPVDDPGILLDVDTPEDLDAARRLLASRA